MPWIRLVNAATGTNGAPSTATDGVSLRTRQPGLDGASWRGRNSGVILLKSTAGSGTMTVTVRMWAYSPLTAAWHPLGSSGTEADRGKLNGGNAIDEDGSDNVVHAEPVSGLGAFTRLYSEITAIGGTATAITIYLTTTDDGMIG